MPYNLKVEGNAAYRQRATPGASGCARKFLSRKTAPKALAPSTAASSYCFSSASSPCSTRPSPRCRRRCHAGPNPRTTKDLPAFRNAKPLLITVP
ncbi:hypothetical protein [Actinacidiphila soli]|uniref:hypothetical protein n=1 Tax=Actinacidiphila soli TaxID=2487275 RepID=UPI000FCBCA95|nr:hypothetical protein [Actinacidiphila soli]